MIRWPWANNKVTIAPQLIRDILNGHGKERGIDPENERIRVDEMRVRISSGGATLSFHFGGKEISAIFQPLDLTGGNTCTFQLAPPEYYCYSRFIIE